ncbi:MAG: insulinase family protein [Alphaproteobacteria bacterium]|nr:insulinase family protein [Alphaproteobacteria bacterium]
MTRKMTVLPNGLRVVTDSMDELDTVALGIWVGVGAMYEPAEMNGISHLLEHMAFKGTTSRTARQIAEEIENVGGYINACTSRETTSFYIKVLKEDTPLAVDILADILQNSTFDPEEFAREKTVVLQEISQSNDTPDDIVFDYFQECAFPDQPVGRPVLGSAETVQGISRETLDSYMKANYTPKRMVAAASGKINHEEFVRLIEKAFGSMTDREGLTALEAVYRGGEIRKNKPIEQVNLVLGFPGVSIFDDDYYTAHVLSTVFGGGMSSRLFQEIREKRGLVYSVYSFNAAATKGGLFGIYAGTGEEEAAELMPAVCDEILKIRQEPVSAAELARAKAQLKAGVLMSLEHPTARSEQNAGHLLNFGRLLEKEEILEKIAAVTEQDVQKLAQKIFSQEPTLASLGPVTRVMSYEAVAAALK